MGNRAGSLLGDRDMITHRAGGRWLLLGITARGLQMPSDERLDESLGNSWPPSPGVGGRIGSESVAGFGRNMHPGKVSSHPRLTQPFIDGWGLADARCRARQSATHGFLAGSITTVSRPLPRAQGGMPVPLFAARCRTFLRRARKLVPYAARKDQMTVGMCVSSAPMNAEVLIVPVWRTCTCHK